MAVSTRKKKPAGGKTASRKAAGRKAAPSAETRGRALHRRIKEKTARVGIIGLGYVGLPLACLFAEKGFVVTGFDVDPGQVDRLNTGRSYIKHIPGKRIAAAVRAGRLEASADFRGLRRMDAILICVPTPLTRFREPDLQFVAATGESIARHLRAGQLVVLESSTYPGTTT